jgi:hypothetical protein
MPPDPGNASVREIEELLALAQQLGTRCSDLDEIVHEVVSWRATEINNAGLEAQVRYLTESIGPAQARILLQGVTEENEEQTGWQDTSTPGETP